VGLTKTLESVKSQSFRNFEHIIVDGGSIDDSKKQILNYTKEAKYLTHWCSEPDNGVYHAQNKGILRAIGEYCFFLNSGDFLIDSTVLEKVFIQKHYADVIYGNLIVLSGDKQVEICKGKEEITFLDLYSSIVKHQASFIKKKLFDKFGLYNENLKIIADWAFFLKTIGLNNASLQYVDIDISCFDNNGISYNNPDLCRSERQIVLDQHLSPLMQKDYLLLQKYNGIQAIDKVRWARILHRILSKVLKNKLH
jgi:glycosyltransferase involved in cell wall biosynthesis